MDPTQAAQRSRLTDLQRRLLGAVVAYHESTEHGGCYSVWTVSLGEYLYRRDGRRFNCKEQDLQHLARSHLVRLLDVPGEAYGSVLRSLGLDPGYITHVRTSGRILEVRPTEEGTALEKDARLEHARQANPSGR